MISEGILQRSLADIESASNCLKSNSNRVRTRLAQPIHRPDDFGNEWVIRFQVTPVIPNPFK